MNIFLLTGSPLNPSTPASTCRYDSSLGDECKVHICVFLFKKCSFWDFSLLIINLELQFVLVVSKSQSCLVS
jgi:hypothetical protein